MAIFRKCCGAMAILAALAAWGAGCGTEPSVEDARETGQVAQAIGDPRVCIIPLCAEGFCLRQTGPCSWVCVACPETVPCGTRRCAVGDVCCNASCGICTEPGGVCIQLACEGPGPFSFTF